MIMVNFTQSIYGNKYGKYGKEFQFAFGLFVVTLF